MTRCVRFFYAALGESCRLRKLTALAVVGKATVLGGNTDMLTEKSFDTGSLNINYGEGAPNGPPMVVLHGIPNRWQGMLQLIGPLAQSWHVFACDMRGHGKSGRCSSYRAIDYAEDAAAFVANRVGSPTVLLGHSGGAMAVLGAAAIRPDLARAVVLLDPPLAQATSSSWPKSTSDFIEGVCRIIEGRRTAQDVLAETLPGITDVQARWFADTFSCVDLGVLSTLLEGRLFENFDVRSLLRQLECPTLMLHGDIDKGGLVRDVDVELLVAHAQHGSAVRIRDTGHFLHAQKPREILATVEAWCKSNHLVEAS